MKKNMKSGKMNSNLPKWFDGAKYHQLRKVVERIEKLLNKIIDENKK